LADHGLYIYNWYDCCGYVGDVVVISAEVFEKAADRVKKEDCRDDMTFSCNALNYVMDADNENYYEPYDFWISCHKQGYFGACFFIEIFLADPSINERDFREQLLREMAIALREHGYE